MWDLLLQLSELGPVVRIVRFRNAVKIALSGTCCYSCQSWDLLLELSDVGPAGEVEDL
jgi:hypothetical protein